MINMSQERRKIEKRLLVESNGRQIDGNQGYSNCTMTLIPVHGGYYPTSPEQVTYPCVFYTLLQAITP